MKLKAKLARKAMKAGGARASNAMKTMKRGGARAMRKAKRLANKIAQDP